MDKASRLWAPWRLGYIKGTDAPAAPPEPAAWLSDAQTTCFLCRAAGEPFDQEADRQLMVAHRSEHGVVVLNRYPYSNCHTLVAPRRHVATLADLTDAEHLEAMRLVTRLTQLMTERVGAQGFNVGLNLGDVAGAGVPGHLHWHVVPRWAGDHNFMATVAGVRVLPQSLDAAWELLHAGLAPPTES
ncbi:HIT family protein [Botrimarina hoheduenensis]|uniref:AP-4-A phosphorylase n=1 Tax=Botrimarina hoheduenensis TaxID=2528000 RepID=A0A5C5WB92_9BACT|nr:HIT domain-containing protein [Botrimarina hoheduenensis]TWT47281.1 AP-4-A phosphorylase [Botrimarina hoheduenensis]